MKKILGLDLGTNSIGWALVNDSEDKKEILGMGSRIIPTDAEITSRFIAGQPLSKTNAGQSYTPAGKRTDFRGVRRLHERYLLRRERLHRVLNVLGFLPEHYTKSVDFVKHLGQFENGIEPQITYKKNSETNQFEFLFQESFQEMVNEFKQYQPHLFENNKKIPYDWTLYYLRKKALTQKIKKEELAWLLLNFNHKRGYNQLRGEEEEENKNKNVEYYSLKVVDVIDSGDKKGKNEIWYNVILENDWVYRRTSKTKLDWIGKTKDFIVTTDLDENGLVKKDKDGKVKRSFRAPLEDDWTLLKKKTETDIDMSGLTVGCYIYNVLLNKPKQKINGKLVRTIERKFYKEELIIILEKQISEHIELQDKSLFNACLEELYHHNDSHRSSIENKGFCHLFLNDIIFYQRPLKSKKSLVSNCQYETRQFIKDGKVEIEALKCIAKSHPLFQEFRLWQFIQNLRIYDRNTIVAGSEVNVTDEYLKTEDDWVRLFEWLNDRKEIDQKAFLKYFKLKIETHRWNYVDDSENKKTYPCNETRTQIVTRLSKTKNVPADFSTNEIENIWHILYSVEDKEEIKKALKTFASKHNLDNSFIENFQKFPPFKKEYGSYSAKAIKKLLPLMRRGKYWNVSNIALQTKERIEKIIDGEYDEKIRIIVREKAIHLTKIEDFINLPLWLVCYIVYDRHAESGDIKEWKSPDDIVLYLKNEFKQHSLRNPIVEQVIAETLRVVNDIWMQYSKQYNENGKTVYTKLFDEIHIELGREMKNPADKRKQMTNKVTENENTNLRIKALLMEMLNDLNYDNVRPYSPSQQEILKIYEDGVLNSVVDIPEDIIKISKQSQPSNSELIRYKLWLDQQYLSPYTGEIIPLNKLFTTAYEIEHIIPQSRYFDNSFSNKVICESEVNKDKDNSTAYEYIKNNSGKKIELSYGKEVTLFTLSAYEDFVKKHFTKSESKAKMKKLLMEDIPDSFIARQLNDSRYISKVVKGLLSNIVREEGEQEITSKNVLSSNGGITNILKQDWGLNDVWNEIITPRFERLNELTKSNSFGQWTNKQGKQVFQTEVPIELQKGFSKKRIDHRHHAMDALVIACATRNHINYLNNEHARHRDEKIRHELRNKLRRIEEVEIDKIENGQKIRKKIKVAKEFIKPWETFTQDAREQLQSTIVSFKQNIRVINKTVNKFQKWKIKEDGSKEKVFEKQTKGDSWAIRKPMHKDTVSGSVNVRLKNEVSFINGIKDWQNLVDKDLKKIIKLLMINGGNEKSIAKYFKENPYIKNDNPLNKVEVYYFTKDTTATRVKLSESFSRKQLESITDSGIKRIIENHIKNYIDDKGNECFDIAFSNDGIDVLNKNIVSLNNGKIHQPVFSVRIYEKGSKFNVGHTGNKKDKFVEAAKGTNLFFAIYWNEALKKREYETIPLNIVIENQKQGLSPVSLVKINEQTQQESILLCFLSPNDLVYVPTEAELENPQIINYSKLDINRIFKMVSCSGTECYFICNNIASLIKNYDAKTKIGEFGSINKFEKFNDFIVKELCVKLQVNRIGNIISVNNKNII